MHWNLYASFGLNAHGPALVAIVEPYVLFAISVATNVAHADAVLVTCPLASRQPYAGPPEYEYAVMVPLALPMYEMPSPGNVGRGSPTGSVGSWGRGRARAVALMARARRVVQRDGMVVGFGSDCVVGLDC